MPLPPPDPAATALVTRRLGGDRRGARARARRPRPPRQPDHRPPGGGARRNNAGFGTSGLFVESDVEREVQQVRILVKAVVDLTGCFAPAMVTAAPARSSPSPRRPPSRPSRARRGTPPRRPTRSYVTKAHGVLPRGCAGQSPAVGRGAPWVSTAHPIETTFPRAICVTAEQCARAGGDGLESDKRVVVPGLVFRAASSTSAFSPRWLQLRALNRFYN